MTFEKNELIAAGIVVNGLYLMVLLLKAFPAFRRIRTLEQEQPAE